jgi:Phosphodiester glycosidase
MPRQLKGEYMKKASVITILIAMCLLLLSAGIINVSADGGPMPVVSPTSQPEVQVNQASSQIPVVGIPHGELFKSAGDITALTGGVTVTSAWTTDENDNNKSTFNAGDSIRWYGSVDNATGSSQTAYFVWLVNGPCGSSTLWSGNLSTGTGDWWWDLPGTLPSNLSGGSYTFTLKVTFNGSTSSKSTAYNVNGSSGCVVKVTSVWTTDGSGNSKSTFNAGDSIRWNGYVYNNTGSSQTAYFVWSRSGPCGSTNMWSGNLSTGPGTPWWYLSGSGVNAPSGCPGNYTYALSVTYKGQVSSKSTSFKVNGVRGINYHISSVNSAFYVFKIDMQSSNLSFETVMANDHKNVHTDSLETVANMVGRSPYNSRNPVLAFNASYFGANNYPQGLQVQNGSRLDGYASPPIDKENFECGRSSLSISSSKGSRIGKPTDCTTPSYNWHPNTVSYYNTVGGGPLFVDNGQRIGGSGSDQPCKNEVLIPSWYCTLSFDWTAVGITKDERYLIVVFSSQAEKMDQAAAVLISEGAWRAMKLDGGGSTQVWYKGQGSIISGRAVANAILVFSTP